MDQIIPTTNQIIPTNKITDTIATMYEYKNMPNKCKLLTIDTNKINNSWKKTKDYIRNFDNIKYYL